MFPLRIGLRLKNLFLTAMLAFCAGSSSAAVILNFIELPNEAGIRLTGVAFDGTLIDVTKLDSETFHVAANIVPNGFDADAMVSRIGITQFGSDMLVNILENDGGEISDQVYVHEFIPGFTVIEFISDPDQFVVGVAPFATVVETGTLQNVLNYLNDRGEPVTINILSDASETPGPGSVPEPGSVALVGVALIGIATARRRKQVRRT